jgi:hypothetical protein
MLVPVGGESQTAQPRRFDAPMLRVRSALPEECARQKEKEVNMKIPASHDGVGSTIALRGGVQAPPKTSVLRRLFFCRADS